MLPSIEGACLDCGEEVAMADVTKEISSIASYFNVSSGQISITEKEKVMQLFTINIKLHVSILWIIIWAINEG